MSKRGMHHAAVRVCQRPAAGVVTGRRSSRFRRARRIARSLGADAECVGEDRGREGLGGPAHSVSGSVWPSWGCRFHGGWSRQNRRSRSPSVLPGNARGLPKVSTAIRAPVEGWVRQFVAGTERSRPRSWEAVVDCPPSASQTRTPAVPTKAGKCSALPLAAPVQETAATESGHWEWARRTRWRQRQHGWPAGSA